VIDPRQSGSSAERLYGWLLRAYPERFRARFGDSMRDTFSRDWAGTRPLGPFRCARFWIDTAGQAVWFGLAERRETPRPQGVFMRSLFSVDWRDAVRSLRATPVVTAIAVLSLALGIGANTALFSILNSMMLKSLPVREPDRLVMVDDGSWTNPIWEQIKSRRQQIFEDAFAWCDTRFDLSTQGQTDIVSGAWITGNMFDVLGVRVIAGRPITMADDVRSGGPNGPVAVVSRGFAERRFGGETQAIGKRIMVDRVSFTIVGVTSPQFFGVDVGRSTDIFVPLNAHALHPNGNRDLDQRSMWWLEIMGRLKPGQTLTQAEATLQGVQPQIREATLPQDWRPSDQAEYMKEPLKLIPSATGQSSLRGTYATPLKTILVVVAAVLLIACANIANLLLARASARRRELSLRLALGASRFRLGRQLLAESLILGAVGAVLGLLIAGWGSALLVRQLATPTNFVEFDLGLDWRVLAFTVAVAFATSLIFGLAPALGVSRVSPHEAIKAEGRGIIGDRRFGLRNMLVVGQIALSLALVVGAALFVRTLTALVNAPLGFDADRLLVANIEAPDAVGASDRNAFYSRLREAAAAIPGAEHASVSILTPIGSMRWNTIIEPSPDLLEPPKKVHPWVNSVQPGFFKTFGTSLLQGRDFNAGDRIGSPRVAIVSESFVKTFFPGGGAVGKRIRSGVEGPKVEMIEIVGVASDTVYRSLRAGFEPTMYVPMAQQDEVSTGTILTVRAAAGAPEDLTRALGQTISSVDAATTFTIRPYAAQLRSAVRQERLVAILGGFFGGLALLLAAIGLYGVTSYSVNRRRGEIGIRMALGANPIGVVRMVMMRVGGLMIAGVLVGGALAWWASSLVSTLLFGLGPRDPMTFAMAVGVLALAGALAGWLPARRAARIDPVRALRES
jgi:predicted permease